MKLIDREPTPEMIESMHERGATLTGMFQAMYDAAPEVKQEPVAIVDANDEGYWADILPDRSVKVGQPLFAYPPDAQAEIAKRDNRIKELEQQIARLKTVPMKYRRMGFNAQLQRENTEQAAEITRLKAVIAKCEEVLELNLVFMDTPIDQRKVQPYTQTYDALAAIKEIDHA